ncbi:conserved hypothetical integral membrane protein [Pilibacter termitis]|uniref:Conserved hypothetical integral membrane protein n=1 Tax=Pilibacter termitis TaxID=263852 RepID=A0A1T4QMX0_9ENTE|nr:DUF1146 family protein [Pilibacter termitis]SKA04967.1 conserved hypothetical integral membrane protein [Pilibacter termitis]
MVNTYYGLDALGRIITHFIFIYLAFWSLQSMKLENLFKPNIQFNGQIRFVYFFLAIMLGYTASSFFQELLLLTKNLLLGL